MPLEANIGRWDVTVLQVSRIKRHLDRAVLMQFWEILDKYASPHFSCDYFSGIALLILFIFQTHVEE